MTGTGKVPFVNIEQMKRCFALLWKAKVPACVIGGVGSGKTSGAEEFVQQLNEGDDSDFKLWKLILSVLEPSDFGVPYPKDGKLEHLAPSFLPFGSDDYGVILADEFDRAKPDTQNAFLQLLLGGEIHGHKISENAYIIMTMNGESDIYTNPLSSAARTRVCSLFVSTRSEGNSESWDKWAEQNGVSPLMRGFAKFRPDLIESHEEFEELAIPTNRTRDMADAIIRASEEVSFEVKDVLFPCLAGVVGKACAIELMAYKTMHDKCPEPEDIIKNPDKFDVPEEMGICYAIGLALVSAVKKDEKKRAEAVVKYCTRMNKEVCAFVMIRLGEKCPMVISSQAFLKWVEENKVVLA